MLLASLRCDLGKAGSFWQNQLGGGNTRYSGTVSSALIQVCSIAGLQQRNPDVSFTL